MLMRCIPLLFVARMLAGAEVVEADRWLLHNSFWMNLHQTLMHEATTRSPRDLSALTDDERATWTDTLDAYREAKGEGSITFSRPMMNLQNDLAQVADRARRPALQGALAEALLRAAPVYRAHWWEADHVANRFFLHYLAPMIRDAGEEILRDHERVYGETYPRSIRIDIAAHAGRYGAYSHPLRDGFVVTIASRDEGNHGLTALEMVLHESSHSVVFPYQGRVNDAIVAASKRRGVDPPRDLWHAILFATTSELTKRAYARRGITWYVPTSQDLLTRAWPQYREPIETHWIPYIDGKGTLEEAIEKLVEAAARD
jgi:hypothetical protein